MELYEEPQNVHSIDMNSILSKTFTRMSIGLLVSAVVAFYAYYSGMYVNMVTSGFYAVLAILELVVVFVFSLLFAKLPSKVVTVLYFTYAILNGITLSVLFSAYDITSVAYAFVGTAGLFSVLAYMGYNTEKDISNWRVVLSIALFIGIILTVINLFIGSTLLDIILDWAILLIFFGLTVYDVNKIKRMQEMGMYADEKLYIYGAMQLYLDFINIFLRILSIFGRRRD